MKKLAAVLVAMWLGMQLAVGYLVAPVLFEHMGKQEAGNIAGGIFDIVGYSGLIVWALMYFVGRSELSRSLMRSATNRFVALLWLLIAVNQFLITPVIQAHKTQTDHWLLSLLGGTFGMWHGISSVVYMVCSVVALGLVLRLVKLDWH